jgi:tetratricopeptide (TPR) repeat protein
MQGCAAVFRVTLFFMLVWCPLSPTPGLASQRPYDAEYYQELMGLFREGNRLVNENEHEEAYAIFRILEERAREAEDPYWRMVALWKRAQSYSSRGDVGRSIELFEASAEALRKAEQIQGRPLWANRWLLHSNLVTNYRNRGQMGEAFRVHRMAEDDAIAFFRDRHETDIRADPFTLALDSEANLTFLSRFVMDEGSFRFLAGQTDSALALTQRLIDRYEEDFEPSHWNLAGLAQAYAHQIYRLHRIGRHEEAMVFSEKLLGMEESRSTSYERNREQVRAAYYRIKRGEPAAPLIAQAEEAMEAMRVKREAGARLHAAQYLARIYAAAGDSAQAWKILEELVKESRQNGHAANLSAGLLTRAELKLEAGEKTGVEADLLDALGLLRQQGQWRLEVAGYALYAKLLLAENRLESAREICGRGLYLARRFDEAIWLGVLLEVQAALMDRQLPGGHASGEWVDLQPVRMSTQVAQGELARGRFVVTNPGSDPVQGELTVTGRAIGNSWNAQRTVLAVEIDLTAEVSTVSFPVTLAAGEEVSLYLQTAPATLGSGSVSIGWRAGEEQIAFWEFDFSDTREVVSVVTANVVLENLFYAVPLYQEIYYRGSESIVQSLRVRTSQPSRLEIVDQASGQLLAVDANGDGDFSGIGDVVFRDNNRDGFPDLPLAPDGDFAALLIFVFPEAGGGTLEEMTVEVDLLQEGGWRPAGTNQFIPHE